MRIPLLQNMLYAVLFCSTMFYSMNQAEAVCEAPDVLIVLDRSCSMGGAKWTSAVNAIKTITNQYKGKLRFGLATFNSSAGINYGINNCIADGLNNQCVPKLQTALNATGPSGGTNLVAAMNTATSHLTSIRNADSVKTRKRSVMFITDGQAGCANSQVSSLFASVGAKTFVIGFGSGVDANCLNNMATAGKTAQSGTRKYYQADNSTELNKAMKAIADASSAEICNNLDDDCDGQIDEGIKRSCSTACGAGQQVCSRGKWGSCSALNPQPEVCDSKDNDCDGKIDEDYANKGKSCSAGTGGCKKTGTYVCKSNKVVCSVVAGTPSAEVCDGKDNDCNGQVDDNLRRACSTKCGKGQQSCTNGKWDACNAPQPQTETCNDKDDDCDGQVDEGVTRECSTICGKGTETCKGGKFVSCDAQKPVAEVCDGKDNDCNGKVDDGVPDKACRGKCGSGTQSCQNGQWDACNVPQPTAETCNGKDDDCNGQTDDGLTKNCRTACGSGQQACNNGAWGTCSAPKPGNEVCDGKDNDCNGKIDDSTSNLCPSGMQCKSGQCKPECLGGECAKGLQCVNGICEGVDPCKDVKCASGSRCSGGKCIDLCFFTSCLDTQKCEKGVCIEDNCYTKGCPNGEKCIDAKCQKDPCTGVNCPADQFCREGTCVDSCFNVTCKSTERCVDGKCTTNPTTSGPCENVTCNSGEVCNNGKCEGTACSKVTCPTGRKCINGVCEHNPCLDVQCPEGVCHIVDGKAQCVDKKQVPEEKPGNTEGNNTGDENPTNTGGENPTNTGGENPNSTGENPQGGGEKAEILDGGIIGGKGNGDKDTTNTPGSERTVGGCGCQVNGTSGQSPFVWMLFAFVLFGLVRRRQN